METKTILTLIGFVVVLFGYIAVHRLTESRNKRADTRSAVLNFKSAFALEIAAISNNLYAIDTFPSAFERHEAAVDAVRPILPEDYQRKLQKAWDDYCGQDNGVDMGRKEFIAACNASLYSTDKELFQYLENKFIILHKCLDNLI